MSREFEARDSDGRALTVGDSVVTDEGLYGRVDSVVDEQRKVWLQLECEAPGKCWLYEPEALTRIPAASTARAA